MALSIVIIAFIAFILADIIIRYIIKKYQESKAREEREAILKESLNLDFSSEAKTLKRAEVENAKAKILCVDDEQVILDSFRKILVLDGYSIDTVETGQEALGLVQKHHYDFVFTDLKMPQMSGEDVCKAVKHLRPDIDVIVITGYASVESAVETMKYGAMDYIQKPFTEEELTAMVKKFVIKRHDRISKQLKPKVHITHLSNTESLKSGEFTIPGGVFISEGHCWASVGQDGTAKIGVDDFAKKVIGKIDGIELPNLGMSIKKGQNLFGIKQGSKYIQFKSPVSGQVSKINTELEDNLDLLDITTYEKYWLCTIDADNLDTELKDLKIGNTAVTFYHEEIDRYQNTIKKNLSSSENGEKNGLFVGEMENLDKFQWEEMSKQFFEK